MRPKPRSPSTAPIWLKVLSLCLACLVLQACSAARIAYSNAPFLAHWRLDSYLDLSDDQSTQLRTELERLHRWHMQTQLPRQLDQMQAVQRQLMGDIAPQQACTTYMTFHGQFLDLLAQAELGMAQLSMSLDAEQLDRLQAKQASDLLAETGGRKDPGWVLAQRARYDQWRSRSESLYGDLEPRQEAALRAAVATSMEAFGSELALRKSRQEDLLATLRQIQLDRPSADQARERVRALVQRIQMPSDRGLQSVAQNMRESGCRTFAMVHNATTQEQRQRAARTIGQYVRDFRALAAVVGQGV
jgi:hypothetical protein